MTQSRFSEINALRGSPPSNQILEASYNFDDFIANKWEAVREGLEEDDNESVDNYGKGKALTRKLKTTLESHGIGGGGDRVDFYQNSVDLVGKFIDASISKFRQDKIAKHTHDGQFDQNTFNDDESQLVVVVEELSYDRVLKLAQSREDARLLRIVKAPFNVDGELDLSDVDSQLCPGDVPLVYWTPVNNPLGLDTTAQAKQIYNWSHAKNGSLVADYAYHFLNGNNSEDSPVQALSELTEYADICLAQFSKVTGQNTPSIAVYKEENEFVSSFLGEDVNANFTDIDQRKIAYLNWMLSTGEGRRFLYQFEQKGRQMIEEVRELFRDSSLCGLVNEKHNYGYFEAIRIGLDRDTAEKILETANINAEIINFGSVFAARISYSLSINTIEDILSRLEQVIPEVASGQMAQLMKV